MTIVGRSSRFAFTLIEVLMAIVLLLALLAAMFGFFFDMLNSRAKALDSMWRDQAATTLIGRLEADLACCMVGDSRIGPGVRGGPDSLRVLTRGVALQVAERGIDDPAALGDLQFTDYSHNHETHRLVGRAGPASESQTQQERELSSGTIHRLRFRYHDGEGWRQSFDSMQAGRLPLAVEVAIWFVSPNSHESEGLDTEAAAHEGELDAGETGASDAGDDWEMESQANRHPPDRIRVLVIPDAGAGSEQHSEGA